MQKSREFGFSAVLLLTFFLLKDLYIFGSSVNLFIFFFNFRFNGGYNTIWHNKKSSGVSSSGQF